MKADATPGLVPPEAGRSAPRRSSLLVLALLPRFVGLYQTQLLTYGLVAAIAALGFNLLLGYTGLLSFGHSAYFGIGAYTRRVPACATLGIHSMELYILVGRSDRGHRVGAVRLYLRAPHADLLRHPDAGAVAGAVQPGAQVVLGHRRHRRPAGARGRPCLPAWSTFTGAGAFQRFINGYYYYVLGVFAICVVLMWVIVHSPFGKALQAIRDNETRADFLGHPGSAASAGSPF